MKNKWKYYIPEVLIVLFILTKNITSIACFAEVSWIYKICSIVEVLICLLLVLSCKTIWLSRNKIIYVLILFFIFLLVFWQAKTIAFILGIALYFTTRNVRFEKVMDMSWKVYFALIIISFVLYFIGVSDGGVARTYDISRQAKAYGFTHPNVGGEWIAMMLISKMYVDNYNGFKIRTTRGLLNCIFYMLCLLISYCFLKCRTSIIIVAISLVCLLFYNNIRFKNRFIKKTTEFVQPFILIFSVVGAIIYPFYGTNILDIKLAHRIYLCHYHYLMNGFSLFGKLIDYSKYTLDNSYMSFLLQFGIIPMLIYTVFSILVIKKAWKQKDGAIISIAIALFLFGYMENGIFDLTTNFAFIYLLTGNDINVKKEKILKEVTL